MSRIVLQGSVFGPIKCSVQMDTIGKEALQTGVGIFKYKDVVDVPSLAMIDDLLGMSACGDASIELNAIINAKIENKKLRLSEEKCYKIHMCKKTDKCPQILKVHDHNMKTVSQATYLGDVISDTGTIDATVAQRCQKATGLITQISSILSSITLGNFHFDIAMVLRESQFVNSIMTNSEIWHNVYLKHTQSLEQMDHELFRKIFNAHSKTPCETFFYETGKYPLRFIWAKRRLMYLWQILRRGEDELVSKVYKTQKLTHTRGDWYQIVKDDKVKYGIVESDEEISEMSQTKFKKMIENKLHESALKYLRDLANKHSKSTLISEEKFGKKAYLKDRRFSKEDCQLLFALKTKMIDCKSNFSHLYDEDDMSCRICKEENSYEDEDHLMVCKSLNTDLHDVTYSDVYGNVNKQHRVTQVFKKILRKRNILIETMDK